MAMRSDTVSRPGHDHEQFARLVLEHPGAVVVLAVDEQERVLVLEQYRHAAQRRLVELPAGLCDAGEDDPLATAQRELLEEAELTAAHWEHLLTTHPSPGISSEQVEIFVALDLAPADRGDFVLAHEEADMTRRWVPLEELVAAVLDNRVADGPLGLAVLAYAHRRLLDER
ncbi:MAG TPA: NUDIX hydrolase [Nocardioidaceae bacterium]|nr:NUDIX hydrolase [Nocardioidaceae bacterium]